MNKDIVILDLFSGIGGFSKGLIDAGFNITKHMFSEIDKHAIAVYKYNFKNSEYVGSVTTLDGRTITRPNIITFGSPCQDFSVAGKRAGMEGQRSSLIGEAIRLITECRPDIFIWENVKGVFSSNSGADFWAIIQAFTNIGGYRLEWQLLNTAWFLPQNRERIYLVGHLAERGGRLLFPIRENVTSYIKREGGTKSKAKPASTISTREGGRKENNFINVIGHSGSGGQHGDIHNTDGIMSCLTSTDYKQPKQIQVVAQRGREEKCLTPKRTEYGKEIRKKYEKGEIQEQRKNIQQLEPRNDGVTNTLTGVQKDNLIIVANTKQGFEIAEEGDSINLSVPNSKTRRGRIGKGVAQTLDTASQQAVILPTGVDRITRLYDKDGKTRQAGSIYNKDGIAPTLDICTGGHHTPMIIANAVTPDAYLARGERNRDENGKAVLTSMHERRIRRLTEIECELLQGFPENWTLYGDYDGVVKKVAKTQRYKMCGNAVTCRVVEEIGKRLLNS